MLLHEVFPTDQYIVNIVTESIEDKVYGEVFLLFKSHATKRDIILGLIHAYIARILLSENGYKTLSWLQYQSTKTRTSPRISEMNYVRRSKRILQGLEVIPKIQLSENEADSLCDQLMNHPEWLIEEMHLETTNARIHTGYQSQQQ